MAELQVNSLILKLYSGSYITDPATPQLVINEQEAVHPNKLLPEQEVERLVLVAKSVRRRVILPAVEVEADVRNSNVVDACQESDGS